MLAKTSVFPSKEKGIDILLEEITKKNTLPASRQVIIKCLVYLAKGRMNDLDNADILALSKETSPFFVKTKRRKNYGAVLICSKCLSIRLRNSLLVDFFTLKILLPIA